MKGHNHPCLKIIRYVYMVSYRGGGEGGGGGKGGREGGNYDFFPSLEKLSDC